MEISFTTVIVRTLLAFLLGALIGIEREMKGKSAGLKTHALICVGAAMASMINQYLVFNMGMYADLARMGAQVIAGVGFIGAGVIYISRGRAVRGLTTAAGVWLCAIIGLCVGSGYFETAILAAVLQLLIQWGIGAFEKKYFVGNSTDKIFIVYTKPSDLSKVKLYFRDLEICIVSVKLAEGTPEKNHLTAEYEVSLQRKLTLDEVLDDIRAIEGIISAEQEI